MLMLRWTQDVYKNYHEHTDTAADVYANLFTIDFATLSLPRWWKFTMILIVIDVR